jgi:hypothetical protein
VIWAAAKPAVARKNSAIKELRFIWWSLLVQFLAAGLNLYMDLLAVVLSSVFMQNTCTANAVVAGRGDLLAASRVR